MVRNNRSELEIPEQPAVGMEEDFGMADELEPPEGGLEPI